MKVALVMPSYFGPSFMIAGAERYAYGLAKALAKKTQTTLFSFGEKKEILQDGELTLHYSKVLFYAGEITHPVSFGHLKALADFDVIHCLQFKTIVTELAILAGAFFKKKIFVTDLAGRNHFCLSRFIPLEKQVREFLFISEFNRGQNQELHGPSRIIYGGVNADFFTPPAQPLPKRKFLYVGRIFFKKGIHLLIEALPEGAELDIVGQCHEADYLEKLKAASAGKKISFYDDLSDEEIRKRYQASIATVLPSLVDGGFTSAIESMACGTPVIGTNLGSLPEVVRDGETGFLVPPQDVQALREKMIYLSAHPEAAQTLGQNARRWVLQELTWALTADRCLRAYAA